GDYSNITRLEWMGDGEPGTYEEYLLRWGNRPFHIEHVFSDGPNRMGSRTLKALVLVNSGLYPGIQNKLNRYISDLTSDGYSVELYTTSGGTPQELKTFITANAENLVGCLFVGDHPVAWYELNVWGYEQFPCDLYYMDLDGNWYDNDSDGRWDGHTAGSGDEGPEIFIGHMDASMMSGNEAQITNDYLDKNHSYRIGELFVPGYALSYTEDDWAYDTGIRRDIKHAYACFDDIYAPDTNRDDYVNNRVPNTNYEFVQMCCHSSSTGHYFTRGGWAWNYQIQETIPHATFFNLFACSSLRYTDQDYLGGSYIYDTSETSLSVIGSTKTGSMLVFSAFYQPFGSGETFGEAFRQWFNTIAPYNSQEKAWHFGMTITGDPFLGRIGYPPTLTEVIPCSGPIKGGTRVTLRGSNFNYRVASVWFGDKEADIINRNKSSVFCNTPPGDALGHVDVTVISLFGSEVLPNGFEYIPNPPEVINVDPGSGSHEGGTPVILTGDYFTSTQDTQVLFGGIPAIGVDVVDSQHITCTTPPCPDPGFVNVTVTNSNGTGTGVNLFWYTYPPPEIVSIDPDHGPYGGGNTVTIHGNNLTSNTYVFFDILGAFNRQWIDEHTITCSPPPLLNGTVDVLVINEFGHNYLYNAYTYLSYAELSYLGGSLTPGGTIALKVEAPYRPNQGFAILTSSVPDNIFLAGLGIWLNLSLTDVIICYNSFWGGQLGLNENGERTVLIKIPSYPPGLSYWQGIVGTLTPIDLIVSNRLDLEITE
ncbi:MAG: IPT/TIG domain-containing protein, partial [Thermoplasmata archaeon]